MIMRTWKSKRECHFCHCKEGDNLFWDVKSVGDLPGDNWEKSFQNEVRLVEVTREFSKEDKILYYVCSNCMLLSLFDESRTNYRYGFRLSESKEIKIQKESAESVVERKDGTNGEQKEIEKEEVRE